MRISIVLWTVLAILTLSSKCALADQGLMADQGLKVGQIWNYDTRSHEPDSKITIVQFDSTSVHVSVSGLKIKDPQSEDGIADSIGHLPLSRKVFENSATKLLGVADKLPNFEDGLNDWTKAMKKGEATLISIPIKEVIRQVEFMINQ